MPQKLYYVSLSAYTIAEQPSQLADQFTVLADDDERTQMQTLLQIEQQRDERTHLRAVIPYKSADHDESSERYNDSLIDVYRYLYKIGTPDTKRHIERMNILAELRDPDYHHPGY